MQKREVNLSFFPNVLQCPIALLSCLKAVAAGAVFAVASVADVDLVEFAVHAVGIVTAFAYAARYAAVDFTFHDRPSFPYFDLF